MPSLASKAGTASARISNQGAVGTRTTPGMSAGAKALAEAFDISPAESATAVEAQAFSDEITTSAEPVAARRADDQADAATTMPRTPALFAPRPLPTPKPTPLPRPAGAVETAPIMSEDDMEIGEVSRVVKLADIAKMSAPKKPKVGRTTGSVPKIPLGELGLAAAPGVGTGALAAMPMGAPMPSESVVAAVPAAVHRRGMMIMLGAAALLLAGGIIAVVLLVQNGDDEGSSTLGHSIQYDTNRPDDMRGCFEFHVDAPALVAESLAFHVTPNIGNSAGSKLFVADQRLAGPLGFPMKRQHPVRANDEVARKAWGKGEPMPGRVSRASQLMKVAQGTGKQRPHAYKDRTGQTQRRRGDGRAEKMDGETRPEGPPLRTPHAGGALGPPVA